MKDLLVSFLYQLYLKGYARGSEGKAVQRGFPAKRHPISEKPLKKRKMVHISIKQTSERLFN